MPVDHGLHRRGTVRPGRGQLDGVGGAIELKAEDNPQWPLDQVSVAANDRAPPERGDGVVFGAGAGEVQPEVAALGPRLQLPHEHVWAMVRVAGDQIRCSGAKAR